MKDVSALKPPPFARIGDPISQVSTPAPVSYTHLTLPTKA